MKNKPSKEKNGYRLVVKANELVQLSETKMSLAEMRAFAYIVAQLDYTKENTGYAVVAFRRADFCRAVGIRSSSGGNNKYLEDVIEQLQKTLLLVEKDGNIEKINLLTKSIRPKNPTALEKETVSVEIHRDILPFLTGLKKNFTEYTLENVMGLKSKHAFRLYEFLKSFHSGLHTASIERLKKICPGEYETVADYIRKTITPALKEINEKTDLFVEWEKKKNGRYVVAIVFNVVEKQDIDEDGEPVDVVDEPDEFGVDKPWTQLSFDDVAATEVAAPGDDE